MAVVALVSLFGGIAVFSFSANKDSLDFSEFYGAAQMIREGLGPHLYDLQLQAQFQSRVAAVHALYLRPPFEALLFLPLTYVSYHTAYTLWTAVNLGLLIVAVFLIESTTKASLAVSQYARLRADFGLVLAIFLTFAPTTTCLLLGQDSILILLIYTLVFVMLKRGAQLSAGCLLACGLFKFNLILPFLFVLLLRRKWRAVKGFAAVGFFLTLISFAISGFAVARKYQIFFFERTVGFNPRFTPNIRGFLHLLLDGTISASVVLFFVAIFSAAAVWWSAKNWRDDRLGLSFSAGVLATLLASYHLYNYDLTLLLLPVAIVCGELAQRNRLLSGTTFLTAVLIVLFLQPVHFLLLKQSIYALMFVPILLLFVVVVRLTQSNFSAETGVNP